jgi:hypothetical protein
LKTRPKSINLRSNCKYREIRVKYRVGEAFVFIYFLEEKKTHTLTYMGSVNTTEDRDPTDKGETTYDPEEFASVFGFRPPFARTSVKKVTLRENSVFRRKMIRVRTVVNGNIKIEKYFMYFKLTANGAEKFASCLCKSDKVKKVSEKWSDILGHESVRSNDIATVTHRDEVAVQVLNFLKASNSILSQYEPIEIELNEYELKLEYVITYSRNVNEYAIAIVIHDKQDHSNALVTIDFLSK